MLGRDLVRAAKLANHEVTRATRLECDVTDRRVGGPRDATRQRPEAVVNCAAYTDVDGAENDREAAMRVNADGARNVAAAAGRSRGRSRGLPVHRLRVRRQRRAARTWSPTSPRPLSGYGASKLAGEVETAAVNPRHFLVRTSWLFGTAGRNFVDTMLELAERDSQVIVVRDQIGSPT